MRKCATLGAFAVLTGGLLTLPGDLGILAAVVLATAVYWAAASELGPSRRDVSATVGTFRSLALRGR